MPDPTPDPRDLIEGLRGDIPETCDFCGEAETPERMVPEEGDVWVCRACWDRWVEEVAQQDAEETGGS